MILGYYSTILITEQLFLLPLKTYSNLFKHCLKLNLKSISFSFVSFSQSYFNEVFQSCKCSFVVEASHFALSLLIMIFPKYP